MDLSGRHDEHTLDTLGGRLAHRGPDDVGRCLHDGVGLVQTRLSIIDLETGHQPLESDDGRLALVANGEIYNHVELRRALQRAGHRFRTRSDSECILHAYREFGIELFDALDGMFAFALHDRERARLLLARDRLGIKPLFVMRRAGAVLFASEPKALLALGQGEPELEEQVLAGILASNFASGREVVFKGIERVAPGEALMLDRSRPERRWRYWQPRPGPEPMRSEAEAAARFDPLARRVVGEHLRSDVPIGLFLSAGADSGSLLALMHDQGYGPVETFSLGFPATRVANELDAAARVAARFGARHHALEVSREEVLGTLPLAMWAADELMLDPAMLPTALLAGRAAEQLKVVFTGEGGDEVFAGYGRYRRGPLARLWAAARGQRLGGFRARGSFPARPRVLVDSLARIDWHRPYRSLYAGLPAAHSRLTRLQQLDMMSWLPDDLLVKADRILMAFGVEGRVPYLDHRVVEFGLSLSDGLKVRGRTGKWFLKRWMSRQLPSETLFTPKTGFSVPLTDWMDETFLSRLSDLLPRQPVIERYCRRDGVQALIARQRGRGDVTRAVWALLCLAVWHRVLVTGDRARPAAVLDPLSVLE